MNLVERLVARSQVAPPLSAGSLSSLVTRVHDDLWIEQCVNDFEDQEARFSTELLLRAFCVADRIVAEIESQGLLLEFFNGTSRDILLYESLHFGVHALSILVCQTLPAERASQIEHLKCIASLTASILGVQHLGDFDSATHCESRARRYTMHGGQLRDMTESLIDSLTSVRGATNIEPFDALSASEVKIEIDVSIRSAVGAVFDLCITEGAEKILRRINRGST